MTPESSVRSPLVEMLGGRALILLGCGRMGNALLQGWISAGVEMDRLTVIEPAPTQGLQELAASTALQLNPATLPAMPAAAVVAVKPQQVAAALPTLCPAAEAGALLVSLAAGIPLSAIERSLPGCRAVRCMPNTPAAICRGVTALYAPATVSDSDRSLADSMLSAVGATAWLDHESDMDAVTAVSGSGPAWFFAMTEALAQAAMEEGLRADLAHRLARKTLVGAGALLDVSTESPEELRKAVTSPGGTTEAGLKILLDPADGLAALLRGCVGAAATRSRELRNES